MANNELGIKFTEQKYATKSEVVRDLRITAIDSFWSNILAYRSQFNRYLTLKTVDRDLISLCCCSSINALINNVENKLLCLNREFIRIYSDANALEKITNSIFNKIGETSSSPNYIELLSYIYGAYNNVNSEDYLVDLFSKITHIAEITHFYRTDDSVTKEKTALVDRIYKCAPSALIEPMMDDLFNFANDMSLSSITKFAKSGDSKTGVISLKMIPGFGKSGIVRNWLFIFSIFITLKFKRANLRKIQNNL